MAKVVKILDAMIRNVNKSEFEEMLKTISLKEMDELCYTGYYDGNSILHCAIHNVEYAKLVLKYKANVNSPDKEGWAPLHRAVLFNCVETVRILLDGGADISQRAKDGMLPIDMYTSNANMIMILVDYDSPMPTPSFLPKITIKLKNLNETRPFDWKLKIINAHPRITFDKVIKTLFRDKYHSFFNIENRDVISEIKKYLKSENK